MNKLILIILSIFLFLGCASNNKVEIKPLQYPSWYLNPIFENDKELFGIGEDENIDDAIKSALISISSRLSLTITSNSNIYNKSFTDYREYVTKESTQEIFSNTENLRFNNYELINSHKISFNKIIVNVKIKKTDLIKSLKDEITLLKDILKKDEKALINKEALSKYFSYKKIFDLYYLNINKTQILKNLDKEFDDKEFFENLNEIYSKMIKNKSISTFYIINNTNNENIANKLKEEINREFLVQNRDKALYEIEISSNTNKKSSHGFYIIDNNIDFKIYFKNSLIKTKNYLTKGVSSNSFSDALNNSFEEIDLKDFNKEIFNGVRDRI